MPANTVVQASSGLDGPIERLIPYFGNLNLPRASTAEIVYGHGSNPSYALVKIPMIDKDDENCSKIAFTDAISQNITHGSRVLIQRLTGNGLAEDVFTGSVVTVTHNREANTEGVSVMCWNDVWFLRDTRIIGRFGIDYAVQDQTSYAFTYFQGLPAHFNPGGRPNRIESQEGYSVFTPYPDFGLEADEVVPQNSNKKACYWTLSTILEYLQKFYSGNDDLSAYMSKWGWLVNNHLDTAKIEWNTSFGTNVDADSITKFDNAGDQGNQSKGSGRKGRDINLEGVDIASALDLIFSVAGGWSYALRPSSDKKVFKSELIAIPTRYTNAGNSATLQYASSGKASTVFGTAIVTGGTYEESSVDFASKSVVAGDLISCERRVDTLSTSLSLEPAWNKDAEDNLRKYLKKFPTAQGQIEAYTRWPEVWTMYKLKVDFNHYTGTLYSDYPRARISRAIYNTLMSFRGGAKGPKDLRVMQYPITFETSSDTGTTWITAQNSADGLDVADDGTIFIPYLRDAAISWKWKTTPFADVDGDGRVDTVNRDIRCTVSIPMDHRLTAFVGTVLGQNLFGIQDKLAEIAICPDIDRIDSGLDKLNYIDANGLYQLWFRYGAYGEAQSAGGSQLDDKLGSLTTGNNITNAIRSDASLITAHARKAQYERGRLTKSGALRIDGYLVSEFPPGTPIGFLTNLGDGSQFAVRAVVGSLKWVQGELYCYTEIGLI